MKPDSVGIVELPVTFPEIAKSPGSPKEVAKRVKGKVVKLGVKEARLGPGPSMELPLNTTQGREPLWTPLGMRKGASKDTATVVELGVILGNIAKPPIPMLKTSRRTFRV